MSDNEQEKTYDNNNEAFQGLFNNPNKEENSENFEDNNSANNQISEEEKSNEIDYEFEEEEIKINKKKQKNNVKHFVDEMENSEGEESEEDEDYDDEISEDFDFRPKKKGKLEKNSKRKNKKSRGGNRKKKHKRAGGLIDDEAESDEENEISDNEGELTRAEQQKLMNEQLKKRDEREQYKKKQNIYNIKSEQELIEHYENMDEEILQDPEEYKNDEIIQQGKQASITDPKLWLVKCKMGKEKECVNNLYHKFFTLENTKNALKILSALCFDSLKGYIYIEAFKEANVREAIQDISLLRENSIKIVPLTEMTQVFNYDKIERVDIQKGRWVRLKSGIYEGDLAQVIVVDDPISRIFVKIIPRLNEFENSEYEKNKKNSKEKNFPQKKFDNNFTNKPKQKLFNPSNFNRADLKKITHPVLRESVIVWNKMNFLDGFLIKSVRIKSLILEDIDPKMEELRIFNYSKYRKGEENEDDYGMNDLIYTIQESEMTKKRYFKQGDKIRIITGSLNGITGKVISHSQKLVSLIPDIEDYEEVIELPEDYVVKLFLPGDLVKVYKGPNTGKYGLVTKNDEELCYVYSDSLNVEFKVSCRDLILSSQHIDETVTNSYFQIGDLVKINGNNMVCYILSVHLHHLKVIDTRNEIKQVNMKDITKITQNKPNGIDSRRNPITRNDIVKVINGNNKVKKLFLSNRIKKE